MLKKLTDMSKQKQEEDTQLEIYLVQVDAKKEIQDTNFWDLQDIGDIVKGA